MHRVTSPFGFFSLVLLVVILPGIGDIVLAQTENTSQPEQAITQQSAEPAATEVEDPSLSVEQIASLAKPSIVRITFTDRDGKEGGVGTGFVVAANGLIATNMHVIAESRPINVELVDGTRHAVDEIYAFDRNLDLAIIRIDAQDLTPLNLGDSSAVVQGATVVAMGHPHDLANSIVQGIVSARREVDGRAMFQLAMPIEPGNSGGPLLNQQGEVIGLVTMKSAVTENLGFALESDLLKKLLAAPNRTEIAQWLSIGSLDKNDWQTLFGAEWRMRSGRIMVGGMGDGVGGRALCVYQHDVPELPYEIAVSVKLDEESGAAGLIFGLDDENRHYGFYPSGGQLRLSRFDGPTVFQWQVIQQLNVESYHPGQWNHLKVRFEADRFICYVNDVEVTSFRPSQPIAGKVGLAKFRETIAEYRGFQVAEKIAPVVIPQEIADRINRQIELLPDIKQSTEEDVARLGDDSTRAMFLLNASADQLEKRASDLRRYAQDVHVASIATRLRELFDRDEPPRDRLMQAALLLCKLDDAELSEDAYQKQIADMTHTLQQEIKQRPDADRLQLLNELMFAKYGFHGCRVDFENPANSMITRVIDDREGLPITLAILYMELGRAIDLDLRGVNLPGRFVIKCVREETSEFVDVFAGGKLLSREELIALVFNTTRRSWQESFLDEADDQAIFLRVLENLSINAQARHDVEAQLRYTELMLSLETDSVVNRGMRAVLRMETGRKAAAIADLDWIIEQNPENLDMDRIYEMRAAFERAR